MADAFSAAILGVLDGRILARALHGDHARVFRERQGLADRFQQRLVVEWLGEDSKAAFIARTDVGTSA